MFDNQRCDKEKRQSRGGIIYLRNLDKEHLLSSQQYGNLTSDNVVPGIIASIGRMADDMAVLQLRQLRADVTIMRLRVIIHRVYANWTVELNTKLLSPKCPRVIAHATAMLQLGSRDP